MPLPFFLQPLLFLGCHADQCHFQVNGRIRFLAYMRTLSAGPWEKEIITT